MQQWESEDHRPWLFLCLSASTAPPVVGGKKPGRRPGWDLKGQLCDVNAELKRCREKTQTLDQENQQLRAQLQEAQQQASALGTERSSLEGELARVRAQAEQGQRELGSLSARVRELEERLSTQEGLVHTLQKEQLELQEERRTLTTQLEEQEVRRVLLFPVVPTPLSHPGSLSAPICLYLLCVPHVSPACPSPLLCPPT